MQYHWYLASTDVTLCCQLYKWQNEGKHFESKTCKPIEKVFTKPHGHAH